MNLTKKFLPLAYRYSTMLFSIIAPVSAIACGDGQLRSQILEEKIKQLENAVEELQYKVEVRDSSRIVQGLEIPKKIRHCSWSRDGVTGFRYSHPILGDYTLCQSSNNPSDIIYIQLQNSNSNTHICLLQTESEDLSDQRLDGVPFCLDKLQEKKIYHIKMKFFNKNATLKGIRVVQDSLSFLSGALLSIFVRS